jgi:hypothetical protein
MVLWACHGCCWMRIVVNTATVAARAVATLQVVVGAESY